MRELARTLMVQGTASAVGKSLLVAALCRIFRDEGQRVAPFKSQNMALNSFVTPDGLEIGRAQAVQAEAARIEPRIEMNPILLKPEPEMRSQVVLLGRPKASMTWGEYDRTKPELIDVIADCLARLRREFDLVVIEGAGSPAEINLNSRDIVNMHVAAAADAPVLLAADIDRGGVFAHIAGTMELVAPSDRARVAGFVINKFRGDKAMLAPGLDFLDRRFGVPVLGVVPFIERLRIADEDSVALDDRRSASRERDGSRLAIVVIALPSIANFDDFLRLEHEASVALRYSDSPSAVRSADLAIIPGSKNTVADLRWMRERGLADAIVARAERKRPTLGICGGCQMLGERIEDPERAESSEREVRGLALLPLTTRFERSKRTARIRARIDSPSLLGGREVGAIDAYEIHMGRTAMTAAATSPFRVLTRNGESVDALDGAISSDGAVVGTMLHGLFENESLRIALISNLQARRAAPSEAAEPARLTSRDQEYDRLAAVVRENLDMTMIRKIAGLV